MSAFDLIEMRAKGDFINAPTEPLVTWRPVRISSADSLVDILLILDDGLTHGFHYKIENGILLCTQDDIEHEFVHNLLTIKISDKS